MKVLLLSNQPESTIRLKLFGETLAGLGYDVIIPAFGTRNWITIARACRNLIVAEKPDIVHIFNVPDIIYRTLPSLKRSMFTHLIYDYRSPWGIEYEMSFGKPGRFTAEHYERRLAENADSITTVNTPLCKKVRSYLGDDSCPVKIIPNYPKKSFLTGLESGVEPDTGEDPPVLFVGRVCKQEGIRNVIRTARRIPECQFWIVGDGPFSWWYFLNKPKNVIVHGWQPHEAVAGFIRKAGICLIPREENALTPYSNDKSIWKLNEYLNLGKIVVASGISTEEDRVNLHVVKTGSLVESVRSLSRESPKTISPGDFRFWEDNLDLIKNVYEKL